LRISSMPPRCVVRDAAIGLVFSLVFSSASSAGSAGAAHLADSRNAPVACGGRGRRAPATGPWSRRPAPSPRKHSGRDLLVRLLVEELAVVLLPRGAHQGPATTPVWSTMATWRSFKSGWPLINDMAMDPPPNSMGQPPGEDKRLGADGGYVVAFGDVEILCIRMIGLLGRGAGNAHEDIVQGSFISEKLVT